MRAIRLSWRDAIAVCLFVGVGLLSGCNGRRSVVETSEHIFTVFSSSGHFVPGEQIVSIRVQDRDYRAVTGLTGELQVEGPDHRLGQANPLRPGLGKDFRGWAVFAAEGMYRLHFSLHTADGQDLAITVPVRVQHHAHGSGWVHRLWERFF